MFWLYDNSVSENIFVIFLREMFEKEYLFGLGRWGYGRDVGRRGGGVWDGRIEGDGVGVVYR